MSTDPRTLIKVDNDATDEAVEEASYDLFKLVSAEKGEGSYLDHFYYVEGRALAGCEFIQPVHHEFVSFVDRYAPAALGRGWAAKYSHHDSSSKIGIYALDGSPICTFLKIGRFIDADLNQRGKAITGMLLNIPINRFADERQLLKAIEAILSEQGMEEIQRQLINLHHCKYKAYARLIPSLSYGEEFADDIARAIVKKKHQVLPKAWPISKLWAMIALIHAAKDLFVLELPRNRNEKMSCGKAA